jgi:BASS family bile acid:Na+ symporter
MEDSVLIDIGLPLVLAFVMIGIGITLTTDDFVAQRRKPLPLIVGVVGWALLVPLLGFLTVGLFGLTGSLAIGMVLVAATSGGTTSNVLTYLSRGSVALSLVMTVVTALLSILTLPFWVGYAVDFWGDDVPGGTDIAVSFFDVASLLLFIIFLPVGVGMLVRYKKPALAARLESTVSMVSFVVLFGLIIGVVVSLGSEAWTMLAAAGPASLVLATLSAVLGLVLGIVFRCDRRDHLAMAMEFSIKNVSLSMLIALTLFGSEEIALPSAVYGPVAYIPGLAMMYFGRRYVADLFVGKQDSEQVTRAPIVVGYSGSESSMPAVHWAAAEAIATDRPLRVVMAWGMSSFGISPLSQAADFDRSHAELTLNACVYKLRADMVGLVVEGELIRGTPAQGLLDRSKDAALIVVGNRTRRSLSRLVLGSSSSAVISHADVPVVLVRDDEDNEGPAWRTGAVVVGVDGSEGSEAAVDFAMDAAVLHGMSLVAVHTLDEHVLAMTGPAVSNTGENAPHPRSDRLLQISPALAKAREDHPSVVVTEVIDAGHASDAIVAAGERAALTVVGSRGHGGLKGALLGSVSRAVIESVDSPVAVVRPEKK